MIDYEIKKLMINKKSKIFVAGHKGHLGSSIVRELKKISKYNSKKKKQLDLLNQSKVFNFLKSTRPDIVIIVEKSWRNICKQQI